MLALAACVLVPLAAADTAAESIAIMPLSAKRVDEQIVRVLDDLLVVAVDDLHRYKIVSAEDVSALLGHEKLKDAVGCNDVSCAAEIGGALGTRYLLAGTVSRLGSKMLVTLRLIDAQNGEAAGRTAAEVDNNEDMYAAGIRTAVKELFKAFGSPPPSVAAVEVPTPVAVQPEPAKIEAPAPMPAVGTLRVITEPAGAAVTVGGVVVGAAPVAMEQQPEGPYVLDVSSAGYSSVRESLFVRGNGVTEVNLTLLSDADATARADRRFWSTIAMGGGVLFAGGGLASILLNTSQADVDDVYGRYQGGDADYAEVESTLSQHNLMFSAGLGLLAVGAAALGVGTWFFFDVPSAQFVVAFN